MKKFLIGATNSGCGKTTITAGMLRALSRRGLRVQPFKCGPDYIDTQYHRLACGRESVNLDTWFASHEHLRSLFDGYAADADVCIVEGVMGLLDGYDRQHGSSAEIAGVLGLPVVLTVNAKSMAYSVMPILLGYKTYLSRAGGAADVYVVFNNVGSERHALLLRQACEDAGVACIGMIPRIKDMAVPSRHLGLTLENTAQMELMIERAAQAVEQGVDWEKLLGGGEEAGEPLRRPEQADGRTNPHLPPKAGHRIAVAHDEAFNFTYRQNIDWLRRQGEVTCFSPLRDGQLPPGTDFLYLPGGYPEFFLKELSANEPMRRSIGHYIEQGGRCLAECGGMMYLCRNIIDGDGTAHPMTGVLQQDATMQGMKLHLGYRSFCSNGRTWRGHEFHYSSVPAPCEALMLPIEMRDARGNVVDTPIFKYKRTVATYVHLYWADGDDKIFDTDLAF